MGPNIPYHDMAHYVVEKEFDLTKGFYGSLKLGQSIADLSDKEIIKNLDGEAWLAEILARNLQAMGAGAIKEGQFIAVIEAEAAGNKEIKVPQMSPRQIAKIKMVYTQYCIRWQALHENEALKLLF